MEIQNSSCKVFNSKHFFLSTELKSPQFQEKNFLITIDQNLLFTDLETDHKEKQLHKPLA
jgi:hypothetical protein